MFPQVDVANADTFHVVVYDRVTPSRIDVNATHTNHRNAFPTWSTD